MVLEKVEYDITWQDFKKGYSFFIPCLDRSKAKDKMLKVAKRAKVKIVTKAVIEDELMGLRVWRV